jgi:hypothetical protein
MTKNKINNVQTLSLYVHIRIHTYMYLHTLLGTYAFISIYALPFKTVARGGKPI